MNLFDVSGPDQREHFLVSIIIAYLDAINDFRDKDGFTSTLSIINEMQRFGFVEQQIKDALKRATDKKVIETSQRITFEEDNSEFLENFPDKFRATTIGLYHLKRWASSFSYLDAMVFDTPIFDPALKGELLENHESFELVFRYKRARLFKRYLDNVWHCSDLSPPYFDWSEISSTGEASFEPVKKAVGRLYANNEEIICEE